MKRLVLIGGGHAHLSVLRGLARHRPAGVEAVLVTPTPHQGYSGMLPGWMAGHYSRAQCQIDLRPLCDAAHVRLVLDKVIGMDAERHCVALPDGQHIEYDVLSLDVGSETNLSWLELLGERLLPVKPLDDFFCKWEETVATARDHPGFRLVVVGGGAAGAEIALAARHVFMKNGLDAHVDLLASESGLLPHHASGVRRRIRQCAQRAGVNIHDARGVGTEQGVLLSTGEQLAADRVIATTGALPHCWLILSKLALDEHGYVAVDGAHRSISHPNVFAAGDVCARQDTVVPRSGVHAVHAGPVLAHNILASLAGDTMRVYRPRRHSLYLLACGPRYAVASWGQWSAEGAWVWRWKDWIDRRFIARYTSAPRNDNAPIATERRS